MRIVSKPLKVATQGQRDPRKITDKNDREKIAFWYIFFLFSDHNITFSYIFVFVF